MIYTGHGRVHPDTAPPVTVHHPVLDQPSTAMPYHLVLVVNPPHRLVLSALYGVKDVDDGVGLHIGRVSVDLDFLVAHEMGTAVSAADAWSKLVDDVVTALGLPPDTSTAIACIRIGCEAECDQVKVRPVHPPGVPRHQVADGSFIHQPLEGRIKCQALLLDTFELPGISHFIRPKLSRTVRNEMATS